MPASLFLADVKKSYENEDMIPTFRTVLYLSSYSHFSQDNRPGGAADARPWPPASAPVLQRCGIGYDIVS